MKKTFMTLACVGFALSAQAVNPSLAHIQRTMKMLEDSTPENPAHLRVLFYGQSITAQAWTSTIRKQFQDAYPTAEFEFRNAAIGGYTSPALARTAEHDLYPWYPDLLFFHVYGPMDKYEEIVRRTRGQTCAEIILWTSHLDSKEDAKALLAKPDARSLRILELADEYHCMGIDLRTKWCRMLVESGNANTNLLRDGIHLNQAGCDLYAKFIGEEIRRAPELGDNPGKSGTLTQVSVDSPAVTRGTDGSIALRFKGNRVVAVSDGAGSAGATAQAMLDGRPVGSHKDVWAITRPSKGPKIWMPAINQVSFEKPLVAEDWTLTCLPDSRPDGSRVHFKVVGSVTGEDGEGWSSERFVSRSGRVVIEHADWRLNWELGYGKTTLPEGFEVTWTSYPLFTAVYEPKEAGARTLLMQCASSGEHTLTLTPGKKGAALGLGGFVVYAPAERCPAASEGAGRSVGLARGGQAPTAESTISTPSGYNTTHE